MSNSGQIIPHGPEASATGVTAYEPPTFCDYCGAKLNPMFYFCLACATPYKAVEAVIPPHRPRRLAAEELIAIKAPRVWPLFWTYLGVILAVFILGEMLFVEDRPDLKLFFADAALFITTCVFAAIYWRSLAMQLRQFGFHKPAALVALAALIPTLAINALYNGALFEWLNRGYFEIDEMYLDRLREAGMGDAAMVFSFCLIPAVTEEIAFRGLMQHWLQVAIKPLHALLLASALFAALHFSIYSFPYLFGVGMLLGWAKWKTGSLYPSMLIHFLHNLVVVMLFPLWFG